jgi:hypothetical protein
MAVENKDVIVALGQITDGADPISSESNGAVVARTGTGVYTLTLDQALDESARSVLLTSLGGTDPTLQYANTSDTVITVSGFSGVSPADTAFSFVVLKISAEL